MKKIKVKQTVQVTVEVETSVPDSAGFFWGNYKGQWCPYHVQGCESTGFFVDTGALKIPVEDINWHSPVTVPDCIAQGYISAHSKVDINEAIALGQYHPVSIEIVSK